MPMLTVGDPFPSFRLTGVEAGMRGMDPRTAFSVFTDVEEGGGWKVVFFWPKDFALVCPTEIMAFAALAPEFAARGATVLGVSTDSELAHHAWRRQHEGLADLPFPLLSDIRRELCTACGVLDRQEGVALRATFLVDPEGVIRFASANDLSVGRSPSEVLRLLDALRTGALCPADWREGQPMLSVA